MIGLAHDPRGAARALIVPGVLLAAALALFWPVVCHPLDLLVGRQRNGGNDVTAQHLAFREFPRSSLARYGQGPFWNPTNAAGGPYLGNPQAAVLYPPSWAFWAFPVRETVTWFLVGHHLAAGLGAAALCRRLGGSRLASALAGVAYQGSPVMLARTSEGHLGTLGVIAWAPWAFLAYERYRDGLRGGTAALAVALGLATLAGHDQEAYYLVLVLTCFCLFDAARLAISGRPRRAGALAPGSPTTNHQPPTTLRRAVAMLLGWPVVGVATAGLILAELAPQVVFLRNAATTARLARLGPALDCDGPANLLQLLHPFALGGPVAYEGPGLYFWETLCHFGLLPETLAVLGLVAALRERVPVGRLAIAGAVGFVFAQGAHTPLYRPLLAVVPGLSMFRYPTRALLFPALAVAVLAGLGADAIASAARDRGERLRSLLPTAAAILALLVAVALLFGVPNVRPPEWVHWAEVLDHPATFLGLLALPAVAAALAWPARSALVAALLVPATAAELALFAGAVLITLAPGSPRDDSPLIRFLAERLDGSRVVATQKALSDHEAVRHRLLKVEGYDPLPLARTLDFVNATRLGPRGSPDLFGFRPVDLSRASWRLLDLLAVRFAVLSPDDPRPAGLPGWRRVAAGPVRDWVTPRGSRVSSLPCEVWENLSALPRGYVIGSVVTPKPGEDAAASLATLDPRRAVLLDRDVLPEGPRQTLTPARLVEDTPCRVTLEVTTTRPGYLVLADAWYPGWSATLDGRPAPVLPADVAVRALAIPGPGRHRVVFRYWPVGFTAGLAVSALTVVLLAVATIWPRGAWRAERRA
jgi:hypothetical protein